MTGGTQIDDRQSRVTERDTVSVIYALVVRTTMSYSADHCGYGGDIRMPKYPSYSAHLRFCPEIPIRCCDIVFSAPLDCERDAVKAEINEFAQRYLRIAI